MMYAAQSNLKRVYLELGGKSASVVFGDAGNLDEVAQVAASAIFRNSGQVCVASSRLLVERSIHSAFVERIVNIASDMKLGDPLDKLNVVLTIGFVMMVCGGMVQTDFMMKNEVHIMNI